MPGLIEGCSTPLMRMLQSTSRKSITLPFFQMSWNSRNLSESKLNKFLLYQRHLLLKIVKYSIVAATLADKSERVLILIIGLRGISSQAIFQARQTGSSEYQDCCILKGFGQAEKYHPQQALCRSAYRQKHLPERNHIADHARYYGNNARTE